MEKYKSMRIPPITHDQWTQEVRDTLRTFSPHFADLGLSGDESEKDILSPILGSMLHHPALAKAFLPFGRYLLLESELDERCRKLAILRVTWLWRFEYEWAHHTAAALKENTLTENEIEQLKQKPAQEHWSENEMALLNAIDEFKETATIEPTTWNQITTHFTQKQTLDLIFTVGGYITSGMYMNAINLPLKEGMKGFS